MARAPVHVCSAARAKRVSVIFNFFPFDGADRPINSNRRFLRNEGRRDLIATAENARDIEGARVTESNFCVGSLFNPARKIHRLRNTRSRRIHGRISTNETVRHGAAIKQIEMAGVARVVAEVWNGMNEVDATLQFNRW